VSDTDTAVVDSLTCLTPDGRLEKRTSRHVSVISVIPLKADIHKHEWHDRYVPEADFA
jgi:hypothetical protein